MSPDELGRRVWELRGPLMRLACAIVRRQQDAEDAVSETVSRVEEGAKDAASRVESFFEESAGSRVDEELSSAGDRARSR